MREECAVEPGCYWEDYYAHCSVPESPSDFAAFVLSMLGSVPLVVDCGCGNGRDSLFFAQHGSLVFGLDVARSAVALCRRHANRARLATATFAIGDVSHPSQTDNLAEMVRRTAGDRSVLVYARFLLHVLNEAQQAAFLAFANTLCRPAGLLAVEFRTPRDQDGERLTASHYRRYVDPGEFIEQAEAVGFREKYHAHSRGIAKYKNDDAYVYRSLLAVGQFIRRPP